MNKHKWLYRAGIIAALLVLVVAAAAVVLNTASAEGLPFSLRLRSRLSADYSVEQVGPLKAINFSIIGDLLRDLGLSPDEAEQRENSVRLALNDPVPTATALNFEGDPPYTATPTVTSTPTNTPTPTATSTPTRRPTSTPTPTPKPTKVKATAEPVDSKSPTVKDPGHLSPTPHSVNGCRVQVRVSDLVLWDPAPSSGFHWAKLKYKIFDESGAVLGGYFFSSPLELCWTNTLSDGSVEACYSGPNPSFDVEVKPSLTSVADYTGDHFVVKVWAIFEDNAGHSNSHEYGSYTMPATCDDPPSS